LIKIKTTVALIIRRPDNCDGTYDENCDSSRDYTNIASILTSAGASSTLSYMQTYWKDINGNDETFWEHEWSTHGTCISTLKPSCYTSYTSKQEAVDFFKRVVSLFQTLPTYQWLSDAGITPSSSKTYTSSAIQSALENQFGHPVTLMCSSGALNQIYYTFNVQGSVQSGTFVAVDPLGQTSNCPSSGIKYLPKSGGGTATSTGSPPSSTGGFSGTGFLEVTSGGSQKGCIISAGTWYTTGTCATFTASASGTPSLFFIPVLFFL
jgi:ribonuclease T2